MCGIVGIYSFKNNIQPKENYIRSCLKTMRHRGPDAGGIWDNQLNYITGFVRLAIRDESEKGNQPMRSSCGNYCLCYNGEIYNPDAFKPQLINRGVQFKSTSDTEVLLYALIHFGIDKVLEQVDGMFAFAFYDCIKNKLILARDRLGIKPLYVGYNGNRDIIYSSQYDHVINYDRIKNEPVNFNAIGSYLQLGFMADNMGIINNSFLFPHGYYASIDEQGLKMKQYYLYVSNKYCRQDVLNEMLFAKSIQKQLVSDVPIGSFLSGGVDSSLLALWTNDVQPIPAFTIGTDHAQTDEKNEAAWFANKFNFTHHIHHATECDLLNTLDDNFKAYSEPFADFSSIPALLLSSYARQSIKVALSGDGPDELFWGYERNKKAMLAGKKFFRSKMLLFTEASFSKLSGKKSIVGTRMMRSENFIEYYYQSLFIYGSDLWMNKIFLADIEDVFFLKKLKEQYSDEDERKHYMGIVRDIEMNIHLQRILLKMDRAGMYHSLEIRVPYLSNSILDTSQQMNFGECIFNDHGKYNLKQILRQKTNDAYAFKKKKGFSIPMAIWLRQKIRKDVEEKLAGMPGELAVAFNCNAINKMLHRHMVHQEDYSGTIWAIYALVYWYNYHRNSIKTIA